jgi:hypothetical protein
MKSFKIFLGMLMMAFLAGCVPVDSINPLYTDKDLVFDPALLGQWNGESGDKGGWSFAKADDGSYQLVVSGANDSGQSFTLVYEAHLIELQGHRFIDLVPAQVLLPDSDAWTLSLERHKSGVAARPELARVGFSAYLELTDGQSDANKDSFSARLRLTHTFYRVEMSDDGKTLRLIHLDDDWVTKEIESGRLAIAHQMVGDNSKTAVLTADTADLQRLVLDHWNDSEAFDGTATMYRPGFEPEKKTEANSE